MSPETILSVRSECLFPECTDQSRLLPALGLTRTLDGRTTGSIGGAGGESNLEWSAATYLDWRFAKGWTLNVGYRALAWNFQDDDFKWDITFFGPWIGLKVRLF
jgi:hypothetical protein